MRNLMIYALVGSVVGVAASVIYSILEGRAESIQEADRIEANCEPTELYAVVGEARPARIYDCGEPHD